MVNPGGGSRTFNSWLSAEGEALGIELPSSNFFKTPKASKAAGQDASHQGGRRAGRKSYAEEFDSDSEDGQDDGGEGGKAKRKSARQMMGGSALQQVLAWDEAGVRHTAHVLRRLRGIVGKGAAAAPPPLQPPSQPPAPAPEPHAQPAGAAASLVGGEVALPERTPSPAKQQQQQQQGVGDGVAGMGAELSGSRADAGRGLLVCAAGTRMESEQPAINCAFLISVHESKAGVGEGKEGILKGLLLSPSLQSTLLRLQCHPCHGARPSFLLVLFPWRASWWVLGARYLENHTQAVMFCVLGGWPCGACIVQAGVAVVLMHVSRASCPHFLLPALSELLS